MSTLLTALSGGDPEAPGLILGSGGPRFPRRRVLQAASQFASTLRRSGLPPGAVVTIAEPNTVEYVVAFLGATLARAVAAPLNQNYTRDEFAFYMEDAESSVLVTGPGGNAAAEGAAAQLGLPVLALALPDPGAELEVTLRGGELALEVAPAEAALEDPPAPGDEALFLHTSGTTSRSKGVPLTHANLAASLDNIVATYDLTEHDVSLLAMPLFHVHGLMAGLLAPLAAGGAVALPAGGRFSASTFWADAVAAGATYYTAVPTIHQILLARAGADYPAAGPPPLRFIRSCSAALAPATLAAIERAFGAPCLEAYAMTEASHQMCSNPLPARGAHKPGTVGRAQGSVEVAVLGDGPDFRVLGTGEVGEVCVRGPNVTAGYKNNAAANAENFVTASDGAVWFRTGDQGVLDAEGYLALTGRLKELINRGGEKVSPLEVDAALAAAPEVAEAVCFGTPDDKYGEVVAAAVVLSQAGREAAAAGRDVAAAVRAHCAARLAAFKVPAQVFITDELPKTATGKIQRRLMVDAFISGGGGGSKSSAPPHAASPSAASTSPTPAIDEAALPADSFFLVARTLRALGVAAIFGVVGIPVTQLASAAQACGVRFVSCRNEQAAGYAAAAAGFLTGAPGVLLTVSGPGVVHGLAGLAHAQANCWPLLMLSGSCESGEVGKGAFQEADQVAAVAPYVKASRKPGAPAEIPAAVAEAWAAAAAGRPGAAYVDLPSDVLMAAPLDGGAAEAAELVSCAAEAALGQPRPGEAPGGDVEAAAALVRAAQRPLIVIGKGAAYGRAERALGRLVGGWGCPFLATSMGRGVVPDDSRLCANAARSAALAGADVALLFGARLNWQLHFGEAPKWAPGVKFILINPEPSPRDTGLAAVALRGDAGAVAAQLLAAVPPDSLGPAAAEWAAALGARALAATAKLEARLAATAHPLDYATALRVVRDALAAAPGGPPIVVAEGANTMDNARMILGPVTAPRSRLDAGTQGTMGVGPGSALAAAVACPGRRVVAVEGDSAFGFSAMEVETAVRYRLPVTFVVFNNGGVYGGDRRPEGLRALAAAGLAAGGWPDDPAPTAFVPGARHDLLARAFGGVGARAEDAAALDAALREALATGAPTVIDVVIDPGAGVESGNVHAFNAPKKAD